MQELHPERMLALAIIQRALQDLTAPHEVEAQYIRRDAYAFLTKRLWSDDSIWGSLLDDCLVKRKLLDQVKKKVRCLPNGDIEVLGL